MCKKIEKYDDLRTWLAEEDRESMDRFGGQLLANISAKARECVEFVREAKLHITDRRQFSSSLQQQAPANCSRNNNNNGNSNNNLMEPIEKALLFKVWSLMHEDTKEDKEEEEEGGKERAEPTSSGGDGGGDGELIAQVRQEIVRTILKNCSKRGLFERARCLAGGILYEHYCVSAPAHSHRNRIAIDE